MTTAARYSGGLAAYVRDMPHPAGDVPELEHPDRGCGSVALHPISLLKELRFRVTVNTDNRLMSGTSMSQEMQQLVDEAGWTLGDLRWATINAMKSAFMPFDERLDDHRAASSSPATTRWARPVTS